MYKNLSNRFSLLNALFLTGACLLCLSACNKKKPAVIEDQNLQETNNSNPATEEEIKYFFPTGHYDLRVLQMGATDEADGYNYVRLNYVEDQNIIDPKGNLLSVLDVKRLFQKSEFEGEFAEDYEGELFYKTKVDPYKYYRINERYSLGGARTKFYCTKAQPTTVPKDLIFDDNFVVRLYDKNNNILDEHKMRNNVNFEDYKRNPASKYNKMESSRASAWLIGMLKLPPKNKREGLKYRVLRLDKNGKPKPYLYEGAYKYPLQYYLKEEPLLSYSEYKKWEYTKETGCYSRSVRYDIQF